MRSLVVILAVTIGLFGSLFLIALSNGIVEQKIRSTIRNEISHIQLHHPDFMQDKQAKYAIPRADSVVEEIKKQEHVASATRRLTTTAMASTAATGRGIVINGIHPQQEKRVTDIHQRVVEGSYFERDSRSALILIGQKMASHLKAKPGSKVVITIQDLEGTLTYGLFRVTGIFKTSNTNFDEQQVFVEFDELAGLIGFDEDKATEIAVLLDDTKHTDEVSRALADDFENLSVLPWKKIQPLLLGLSAMMDQFSVFLLIIILVALAFGIINTMLMAILERTHEIGMLMAIGMNNRKVFLMIMTETIFLTLVGAAAGIVVSAAAIEITGINGINFAAWSEGMEALGYSALIYPELYLSFYFLLTGLVIVAALLSSIYPARKALKLSPAEAVRDEA